MIPNDLTLEDARRYLSPEEFAEFCDIVDKIAPIWTPTPGPQTIAYYSEADVIGYGGAAGGGKTDLALGKGLNQHQRVAVFRKNGTEHTAFIDRLEEVLGTREGYNGQSGIWRILMPDSRRVQIELGSLPNPGDERKYRGRPHDLKVFDEAAELPEYQVRFLLAWLRSTDKKQKCQALLCFNPPTAALGRWVIEFFAPWLDPKYPFPAVPGELRWFAMIDGKDTEMEDETPFVLVKGEPVFDFNPKNFKQTDIIRPKSRTFISALVTDNPHYAGDYMAQLQALPEPLRSQLLKGDFTAGMEDDPWQVCPTAWVEQAMERWVKPARVGEMMSMGIDVARGGRDNTIIARRHADMWFDEPLVYKGTQTPNGPSVAGVVIAASRDDAPQHIDVIGVGASPYDFLVQANQPVLGINVGEKATGTDKSGRLTFTNQRSQQAWAFREALDPKNNTGIALPPDPQLKADLCAYTWELRGKMICVHDRDEIIKKIGRSPDYASAYFLALIDTPKMAHIPGTTHHKKRGDYNPYENITTK